MANYRLTTEHAASSYGLPVLVDDEGNAYGPLDKVLTGAEPLVDMRAAYVVAQHCQDRPPSLDVEMARRFFSQAPAEDLSRHLPYGFNLRDMR